MLPRFDEFGIELIMHFEGLSLKPYECSGGQLTIGHGHVIRNHERTELLPEITRNKAIELLQKDMHTAWEQLCAVTERELNPNQVNALVSFIYNLGIGNYKSSTLKQVVDRGDDMNVPAELIKWRLADGQILRGLLLRRLAEAKLYIS